MNKRNKHEPASQSPSLTANQLAKRIRRLNEVVLALEAHTQTYFSITRLTIIKGLCANHRTALEFVLYLAQQTFADMKQLKSGSQRGATAHTSYLNQAEKGLAVLRAIHESKADMDRSYRQYLTVQKMQNEIIYPMGKYPVRVIHSRELLLIEDALAVAAFPDAAPHWAYHTARQYTEEYNPRYGTGLIPESLPHLKDIVQWWVEYYGTTRSQ